MIAYEAANERFAQAINDNNPACSGNLCSGKAALLVHDMA